MVCPAVSNADNLYIVIIKEKIKRKKKVINGINPKRKTKSRVRQTLISGYT
jgi:hypothetical protein